MINKKILITGFSGYVGSIVRKFLLSKYPVYSLSRHCDNTDSTFQCDTRNLKDLQVVASRITPDVIVFASGNKNLSFCEKHVSEACDENGYSVKNLIKAFPKSRVIYISSDYVFDGYYGNYDEAAPPSPNTKYGESKLLGEKVGLELSDEFTVLRLSALFDFQAAFPKFLYSELSQNHMINCFVDSIYTPTYYKDFLQILEQIIIQNNLDSRIFHSCGEAISRWQFARNYASVFNFNVDLIKKDYIVQGRGFSFPDISLNNERTRKSLGVNTTSIMEALRDMKQELDGIGYEDNWAV